MQITADYILELAHDMARDEGISVPTDFDSEAVVRNVYGTRFILGAGFQYLSPAEQEQARIEHYGFTCLVEVSRALGI